MDPNVKDNEDSELSGNQHNNIDLENDPEYNDVGTSKKEHKPWYEWLDFFDWFSYEETPEKRLSE